MRKLSLLVLTVGAVAVAGCGSGGGGEGADSPLDNALRYLPADAPFVVAIDTDVDGEQFDAAGDLLDRFPFGKEAEKQLRELVEQRAGGFEDFKKALENEFVVGSTDARSFVDSPGGDDEAFVGAIEVKDHDALDDLISGDKAREDGEVDGAKVYEDDSGDPFAIDGDMLVVAGSRQELEAALGRRDGDDSLTEEVFDAGTEGASHGALVRIYLNVGQLLRVDSDAADALKSQWARAVRTAGIALTSEEGEIAIDVDVAIDSSKLADADLIDKLDGDLEVSIGRDGKFGARAELDDPAAFRKTLAKLEDVLPSIAEGAAGEKVGFVRPKPGEDFYAVATASGDQIVFGVVGDVFVVSNDAAIAGSLAKAVPGGAGHLNGSFEASTDGLSGSFKITTADAKD